MWKKEIYFLSSFEWSRLFFAQNIVFFKTEQKIIIQRLYKKSFISGRYVWLVEMYHFKLKNFCKKITTIQSIHILIKTYFLTPLKTFQTLKNMSFWTPPNEHNFSKENKIFNCFQDKNRLLLESLYDYCNVF